jgi:hypothetical protein
MDTNMLIKYQPKHDHIKCVPLIPVTEEQKKYNLTRSQVSLLPGINEVTDKEWDVMKTHLSREIARKEIITIEKQVAKDKKNPSGSAHNLKDIPSTKEAVKLVVECVNPDTLTKWYQEETRQEVRLAIVEKMKELKVELPKFDPDDIPDNDENNAGNEGKSLDEMTLDELKAYAAEKNITVSGNKAEILATIKEAEEK